MKKITNDTEYYIIKKRIDELLEVVSDENYETIPESIELEFLSELIEEYEKKHYPVSLPTLSEMLKLRMYEMNINQLQLSKMLDVSPSRISEYLSGKEPTLKVAKVMCERLNISANILLGVSPSTIPVFA
jgi:HTH-type transcriptional regulator/antitoxin HigA